MTDQLQALGLDSVAISRCESYVALLSEWNKIHNLSGAKNQSEIGENILDSLRPLSFLDSYGSMLDIGSGAGFPGLILAIARPQMESVLSEPIQKKASFLHYARAELGLENVLVATRRVESIEHDPFALIVSRAVMDSRKLIGLVAHLASPKTHYLFYKGDQVDQEINSIWKHEIIKHEKRYYLHIKSLGDSEC